MTSLTVFSSQSAAKLPHLFRERTQGKSRVDSALTLEYLGLAVTKASGNLASSRMLFGLMGSLAQQRRSWLDGLAASAIGVAWNYITSSEATSRAE